MDAINIMMEEHQNIKVMLKIIRKISLSILNGEEVNQEEFKEIIDFIKNYADKHHHKKEEDYLFNRMVEEIGPLADKLVNQGMLVDHDLGRLYVKRLGLALEEVASGNLDSRLDVIANSIGYANHLDDHIKREDEVVYQFAKRKLNEETITSINEACFEFEGENLETRNKYIELLNKLKEKYEV